MRAIESLPPELARHRVLPTKEAAAFIGLGVSTFRRLRDQKAIPAPIYLSARRIGWRIGDLIDWQDARATAGNDNRP